MKDTRIMHFESVSTFSKGAKGKEMKRGGEGGGKLSNNLIAGISLLGGLKSLIHLTDSRRTEDNHIINMF